MKLEDLKEQIRGEIKDTFRENINTSQSNNQIDKAGTKQINEFLVIGLYGYIRSLIKDKEQAKMLEQFIETYDKDNIMSRKIPDMFERLGLVNSPSGIKRIENELKRYVSRLNFMIDKVDEFVESNYRDKRTKTDMFFLQTPNSMKRKLKNSLHYVIESTRDDAENRLNQRRDELLTSG